jgi:hypothetical protein
VYYQSSPHNEPEPLTTLNAGQILTVKTEGYKALEKAFAGFPARVASAEPTRI